MRASRLVSFLLVLQTRGQLTAAELAERLEVSERTVQRDAQALAEAGIPIVSVRGPAGGYRLERGYRTKLTGLDAVEAEALFVGPAAELGLGRELAAARLKLLASLPAELQERAGRASRLFHVDTRGWFREEDRVPHLPVIAGALWRAHRLDIRYREGADWSSRAGSTRSASSSRPASGTCSRGAAGRSGSTGCRGSSPPASARRRPRRPPDFDLAAAWASRSEAFERSRAQIEVTVRVPRSQVRYLRGARVVEERRPADRDRPVRRPRPRLPRAPGLRPGRRGARPAGAARADRNCGRRDRRALRGRWAVRRTPRKRLDCGPRPLSSVGRAPPW